MNRLMRNAAPSLPVLASTAPAPCSVSEFAQPGVWNRLKQMLDMPTKIGMEGKKRTEAERHE